jgi:hypothetical protein
MIGPKVSLSNFNLLPSQVNGTPMWNVSLDTESNKKDVENI